MTTIALLLIGGLVAIGSAVTVVDYLNWRRAEWGRYGQGPDAIRPTPTPQALGRMFQSPWAGVRWAAPATWQVSLETTGRLDKRAKVAAVADGQLQVTIWVESYTGEVIGAAEREATGLPALARERQYLDTDQTRVVVLTWGQEDKTYQRAVLTTKERLVVVEAVAPSASWNAFEPTFWAVYQSVVLF